MTGGDPERGVLLARSRGKKRATKIRRDLGRRVKATGAAILDETAFRVDSKARVKGYDPMASADRNPCLSEEAVSVGAIKTRSTVTSKWLFNRFNRVPAVARRRDVRRPL